MTAQLFRLGQVVATPGVLKVLDRHDKAPSDFLQRHVSGDWGDTCAEDKLLNDESVDTDARLMSAYEIAFVDEVGDTTIWIITEADRSSTTLLLPSEY